MQAAPDTPAAKAGLQHGDRLVSVNGRDITDVRMFIDSIKSCEGQEISRLVYRSGKMLRLEVQPEKNSPEEGGQYRIGLELAGSDPKIIGHPNPWRQFSNVFTQTYRTLGLLFSPLSERLKSLTSDRRPQARKLKSRSRT